MAEQKYISETIAQLSERVPEIAQMVKDRKGVEEIAKVFTLADTIQGYELVQAYAEPGYGTVFVYKTVNHG